MCIMNLIYNLQQVRTSFHRRVQMLLMVLIVPTRKHFLRLSRRSLHPLQKSNKKVLKKVTKDIK
ncbi:hypothetical protein Hanom_Chr02g00116891 [Helianthus anomalus]